MASFGVLQNVGFRMQRRMVVLGVGTSSHKDTATSEPLGNELGPGWVESPPCCPRHGQTCLSSHRHHMRELWSPLCLPAIPSPLQAGTSGSCIQPEVPRDQGWPLYLLPPWFLSTSNGNNPSPRRHEATIISAWLH